MKKYILIIIISISGVFLNSCNQDLLDITQQGAIETKEYYANASDEEAEALIAYIYKYVFENTSYEWMTMWGALSNDLLQTGGAYSNVSISASNHPANDLFSFFYRVNYLCNMIIENVDENSDSKKQIVGEAYFWRAWANTYLIQGWGNPPLIDHILTSNELTPPNGETTQLWNYVETSLQEAILRLPNKSDFSGQSSIGGRVSSHSAYALLGKAQLWAGNYSNAITSFETVINSNLYDLIDDFTELYHPQADFCKEYMWEWNINDNNAANYTSESDARTVYLRWRSENCNMPGGTGGSGFGFASTLTSDFYNFMVNRGEKGKARYMGTVWDYEDILDKFIELENAENRTEAIGMFWNESPIISDCQGYMRSKMYVYKDETFNHTGNSDIYSFANWPGMRYAEVLLNYAEACVLSGANAINGLSALNKVRIRAGLNELSVLTIEDVKDEKRAELAFEGDRFLDLIRWGDADTELSERGLFSYSFTGYVGEVNLENGSPDFYDFIQESVQNSTGFKTGRDELFPYPYTETLLNENLIQNSNW